jgi:hypothetical protein
MFQTQADILTNELRIRLLEVTDLWPAEIASIM